MRRQHPYLPSNVPATSSSRRRSPPVSKRMNGSNSFVVPTTTVAPPSSATVSEGCFLPEFEHEPANQQEWNPLWDPSLGSGAYDGSSSDEPSYSMQNGVSQQDMYTLNEFLIAPKVGHEHHCGNAPASPMPSHSITPRTPTQSRKTPTVLTVIRQPEQQHRARYLSEGSRGAIKDRSGTSHCTIQLSGFYRPTRIEMFAGTGAGAVASHPLYRLIAVSGKAANTTPCRAIVSSDGTHCLEVVLRPENNMTAVLDCMGILKICTYDVKQRRVSKSASNCSVRLTFRAYIPDANGGADTVIQTESEPIRCMQQLGVPEVFKMSLNSANARGGCDLFIIGRNFDRNTTVLFREYKEDGTLAWSAEAPIDKQFLHQCHIVCTVPTYHSLGRGGTVSVTVKCGSKLSHPTTFQFTANPEDDDWRPPESPKPFGDTKYDIPNYDRLYDSYSAPLGYGNAVPHSSGAFHNDDDEALMFGKRMKKSDASVFY